MALTPNDPLAPLAPTASFRVASADVAGGGPLPRAQYSALMGVPGGSDTSPQLAWSGAPAGTLSYLVTCYDPDAPTVSGFWHWAVKDIPASVTELAAGAGAVGGDALPEGAVPLSNELGMPGYVGAAPPAGDGPHRYYFIVTALDVAALDVPAGATPAVLHFTSRPHVVGRAVLIATGEAPAS